MAESRKFKDPNTYFDAEGVHDFEKGKTQAEINSAFADNAGAHNCIYRGKCLGTSVTAEQWEAIANGTFKDMYIGDFWYINNIFWRIADFDYFLNIGNPTPLKDHHSLILPDTVLYNARMNPTATTAGGFAGSEMFKTGLDQAKTIIKAAFGSSHVLTIRTMLTNIVTNGAPKDWGWNDADAMLMNDVQAFGSVAWGTHDRNGNNVADANGQFPLFMFDRSKLLIRTSYWLRDVCTDEHFNYVTDDGIANFRSANTVFGVRPYFCIGVKEAQ